MEYGAITKWNDEKGFGFITPDSSTQEIFFHISAFSDKSRRPKIGERVFFDIIIENAEKIRAKHVGYLEVKTISKAKISQADTNQNWSSTSHRHESRNFRIYVFLLVLPFILIISYCGRSSDTVDNVSNSTVEPKTPIQPIPQSKPKFTCSGKRHCGQMISRDEAEFYLNNCPHEGMDGDGDGVPCEQQFGH